MNGQFGRLFSPIKIGDLTIRNRIMITGHVTFFAENNLPGQRHVDYYAARAKGGAGLIVSEVTLVHPSSVAHPLLLCNFDERIVPAFRKLTDAVHEHGARIFCQIGHIGREMTSEFSDYPVWGVSAVASPIYQEVPHEMEIWEIEELVQAFGRAARNAVEGGFDGVEIYSTHGYLPQQFMSAFSNKRTDRYGGSLENRLRFSYEIMDCIRENIGREKVLGFRFTGDELADGGLTLGDMKEIAPRLEATGNLDYMSVSAGSYRAAPMIIPDMSVPLGPFVYLAAGIKEVVDLPIFTISRIKDPVQAEQILEDSEADMIGMTRAQICEPELANKAREGLLDDIRPCVACNQGCVGNFLKGVPITCIQNPTVGREKELELKPVTEVKTVMVVGGGPAGMEAACIAASRGHKVSLYERESQLGGQVHIAAKVPSREEFGDIVRYLAGQMDTLGVEIYLDTEVTPEMVRTLNPDAVVLATGSTPVMPEIPGVEQDNVVSVRDALLGKVEVGKKVVVVDNGDAHWQSCSAAEFFAGQEKTVEFVTNRSSIGADIPMLSRPLLQMRLGQKGVGITTDMVLKEVSGRTVVCGKVFSPEEKRIEDVDTVVLVFGSSPVQELYQALRGKVKELHAIGDCAVPQRVDSAIRHGYRVGMSL